jgi:ArsR family transcriptional regulator, arsenate/arsenite/antimonite-responsive transcriptional repressor
MGMVVSDVFQALAHPARREILVMLRRGVATPGELAETLAMPKPTVSGHLNALKSADLIYGERHGTHITYRLNLSVVEESMVSLMTMLGVEPRGEGADGRVAS